jgi:hypothetical protein
VSQYRLPADDGRETGVSRSLRAGERRDDRNRGEQVHQRDHASTCHLPIERPDRLQRENLGNVSRTAVLT